MNIKRHLDLKLGSIILIVTVLLFIIFGSMLQKWDIRFGLFLSQVLILVLCPMIFLYTGQVNIPLSLGFNKIKRGVVLKVIFITLLIYPVSVVLGAIANGVIEQFLPPIELPLALPNTFMDLLVTILFYAITPGICEEFLFRGIIFGSLEGYSNKKKIVITALLFALFHFNPFNFVHPFIMGLVLGYLRWKTDSIYPSMIVHTVSNSIAMILAYISQSADMSQQEAEADIQTMMENLNISVIQIAFGIIIFALIIYGLVKLLKSIPNYSAKKTNILQPTKSGKTLLTIATVIMVLFFAFTVYIIKTGLTINI